MLNEQILGATSPQDERDELINDFQSWAKLTFGDQDIYGRYDNGDYVSTGIQMAWMAWKASGYSKHTALLAQAREALEPFAKELLNWMPGVTKTYKPLTVEEGRTDGARYGTPAAYTIADLETAALALAALTAATGDSGPVTQPPAPAPARSP